MNYLHLKCTDQSSAQDPKPVREEIAHKVKVQGGTTLAYLVTEGRLEWVPLAFSDDWTIEVSIVDVTEEDAATHDALLQIQRASKPKALAHLDNEAGAAAWRGPATCAAHGAVLPCDRCTPDRIAP